MKKWEEEQRRKQHATKVINAKPTLATQSRKGSNKSAHGKFDVQAQSTSGMPVTSMGSSYNFATGGLATATSGVN
jgi:hypothetical protein